MTRRRRASVRGRRCQLLRKVGTTRPVELGSQDVVKGRGLRLRLLNISLVSLDGQSRAFEAGMGCPYAPVGTGTCSVHPAPGLDPGTSVSPLLYQRPRSAPQLCTPGAHDSRCPHVPGAHPMPEPGARVGAGGPLPPAPGRGCGLRGSSSRQDLVPAPSPPHHPKAPPAPSIPPQPLGRQRGRRREALSPRFPLSAPTPLVDADTSPKL